MRKVCAILVLLLLVAGPSWAIVSGTGCDNPFYKAYANKCNLDTDTHSVEKVESVSGIGTDILIYDDENIELISEYKYTTSNGTHSVYGVVKTKKSLFSIIKSWFSKD